MVPPPPFNLVYNYYINKTKKYLFKNYYNIILKNKS